MIGKGDAIRVRRLGRLAPCLRYVRLTAQRVTPMDNLLGRTILVVEDEPVILLDLKQALERASARVVSGAHNVDDATLSGAVLDGALPLVADRLTERRLPFIFCSGREASEFSHWPHASLLSKPASAEAIVNRLIRLLGSGDANRQAIVQSRPGSIAPHDLIITDALKGRRTKSNHRTAEVRAFHDLTELAMRSPEAAVQRFLELAMELCGAGSAGWSRLTQNVSREEVFSWDTLAGEFSPYVGRVMPRNLSPCGLCLDAGKTILVSRPARVFSSFSNVDAPVIEALIVPVYDVSGIALGVLWVVHHNDRLFDAHDARVMEELSVQLVLALKLMGDAKTHGHEIADKIALIRDTDHRVKNTLQSVASLLSLQARSCRVQEARKAIEEAAARLSIFGTVHELLHGNTGDSRAVNIGQIVEKLVDALKATRSEGDGSISLTVQADHVLLEPRVALSISLLVNEAITNAYKHAYPDGTGEICVRVAQTAGGGLRIGVQDDGVGFSPNVHGGLGLTLIRSFASQLGGELLIQSDSSGTLISVTVEQQILPIARQSPNPLRGEREIEHLAAPLRRVDVNG